MSQYIRYEDVPVVIGSLDKDPEFIFANNVSLDINQSLEPKRFLDDYVLSLAHTGDLEFTAGDVKTVLMGPPFGPGMKLPSSIETIPSGTLVSFPTGNKLYVESGVGSGDYYVKLRAKEDTLISLETDMANGEFEVIRNYSTTSPIKGSLSIDFFLNTGTVQSFFNLTGLLGNEIYPQVNETKITGFFGNFFFNDGYIESLSFSTRAFSPYLANASIALFGNLRYDENNIDNFYSNPDFNKQKTFPHAVGTQISGLNYVGMDSITAFSYSIECSRSYGFEIPTGGNSSESGVVPVRGSKKQIDINCRLAGNNLNPYLTLSGKRAKIKVNVEDIGFKKFTDQSSGLLHMFEVYGPINSQSMTVSEGGYLEGNVSVDQAYR